MIKASLSFVVACLATACLGSGNAVLAASPGELAAALKMLRDVGPKGVGHKAAVEAWPIVAGVEVDQLPTVLAAMDNANPLAENWLRSAAETIAQKHAKTLPVDRL
jgi:hypothetical protein